MHDNRDDHEPIIATRRSRASLREDKQPLWRLMLALGGGLGVAVLIAWWGGSSSPNDGVSTTAQSDSPAPEIRPEEHIEQASAPARASETNPDIAPTLPARAAEPAADTGQVATPESL